MSFLNPLILFALAAAAIPLIIHLFNFRRPRKVDFSSLAFVKELQKSSMQRVRIKQWLLLLLRTLTIAFLVLAFARPTITGSLVSTVGSQANSSVVIVVDNSLSMTLRDADGEYLSQAKDIAAGLVDALRSGDEISIMTTAGGSRTRTASYSNRPPALDAIESIEASLGSEGLASAVDRASTWLERANHPNKEIYVIADLQRTTLPDTSGIAIADDLQLYLLPVGERTYANVAVTNVQVESRIIEAGQPMRIAATLVNYGSEPLDDYVASIYLDDERVAQATADLPAGIPTDVRFTASPQRRGWLSGTVEIEGDAFEYDNTRYFTVHVPERRRILLVRGDGQTLDYMRLALSRDLGRESIAFEVEEVPETGLSAAGLGGYDAVVLVGPASLSSGEVAALSSYVEAGGGLLLTPSEASPLEYNTMLERLGGGEITGLSGSLETGTSIASFDRVDIEHPLFEGVFTRQALRGEAQVESPDVYHAINYSPGTGTEQTLIMLSNGFPFLQEIIYGRGLTFVLAVAPDQKWSDLTVRGLFVPLMYRSMFYLSSSESTTGEQLTAAEDGELRIAGVSESEQLRLVGPQGDEYVPEQRGLFGATLLTIEGQVINAAGIYDVVSGELLIRRVAANVDASESDLSSYGHSEARERLSESVDHSVRLVDAVGGDPDDVVSSIADQRTGLELWNVFLLLALLTLVAEMVVARQWRPETVTA